MSTTKIYRDLFKNDGSGEKLQNSIVPILPADLYLDSVNGNDNNDGESPQTALKTYAGLTELLNKSISNEMYTNIHVSGNYSTESFSSHTGYHLVYYFSTGTRIKSLNSVDGCAVGVYGSVTLDSLSATNMGFMSINENTSFTFTNASTSQAILVRAGGTVFVRANTSWNFSGGSVSIAVFYVNRGGKIIFYSGGATMGGTPMTGKRYNVINMSQLIGLGGTDVIPGSKAGTVSENSEYN